MRTTFSVINYIDRVNSAVSMLQSFWEVANAIQNPQQFNSALAFLQSSDPNFVDLITKNSNDAAVKFRNNSGKIFAKVISDYKADILNTMTGVGQNGEERGFLIFLPTPTVIANAVKIDFPITRLNIKGKKIALKGRVGGPARHRGRVIGLGSFTGKNNYQQYFRMDYDPSHGHHGSQHDTPTNWTDGNFHFHTR
jgi:hypothetical protein